MTLDKVAIKMRYKNYKGLTEIRTILPTKVTFTTTAYHTEPQYILEALDLDREALRSFALVDCDFTTTE